MTQNDPKRPYTSTPHDDSATDSIQPQRSVASKEEAPASPELYLASVMATGIAATIVAVLTSFAGLQGTLIGASVGAMVGSISSQIAKAHLARVELAAHQRFRARRIARGRKGPADADKLTSSSPLRPPQFAPRALMSATVIGVCGFAAGMAVISFIETASGQPISATTTGEPSTGTTIGRMIEPIVQEQREPAQPAAPVVPPVRRSTEADATAEALATLIPTSSALMPSPSVTAKTAEPSPVSAVSPPVVSPMGTATPGVTTTAATRTPSAMGTATRTPAPTASPRQTSPPGSPVESSRP